MIDKILSIFLKITLVALIIKAMFLGWDAKEPILDTLYDIEIIVCLTALWVLDLMEKKNEYKTKKVL